MKFSFSNKKKLAILTLLLSALFCLTIGMSGLTQAESFANPAFQKVWGQTDQAVKQGQVSRTWIWGPDPGKTLQEPYAEAPNGLRLVQYFDKSRMEITNPGGNQNSAYYVTNGLLARELVSGKLQTGDNRFEDRSPAQVPVGGDLDGGGPTYATFNAIASLNNDRRADKRSGFITDKIDRAGNKSQTTTSTNLANYAFYSAELGHNIPDVFYGTFLQWKATMNLDWVYAMGLPVTEPFWATFKVAGVEKELLVQIYERRALTFTPGNPPGFLVEMGNIGLHYQQWRYSSPTPTQPTGATTTTAPGGTTAAPGGTTVAPSTPPASTTAPTTAPSTTATPSPTEKGQPTAAPSLDAEETQFLQLINQYRAEKGLGALKLDINLTNAAKWLSTDMAAREYFDHTDSQGRDFSQRLNDFGFTKFPRGENIAAGYETAAQVIQGWKESQGHDQNMRGPEFVYIGIGRVYNANSKYKWYWTTDFGGNK